MIKNYLSSNQKSNYFFKGRLFMGDSAFFIFLWIIFAILGFIIGKSKGRTLQGLLLGALLGIVGVIIIAVLKSKKETFDNSVSSVPYQNIYINNSQSVKVRCPKCSTLAEESSTFCPSCGSRMIVETKTIESVDNRYIERNNNYLPPTDWICKKCNEGNSSTVISCRSCGEYK
jgi:hypothetical protein